MRHLVLLLLASFPISATAQWEMEDSHTSASLRGIHNVGGGVAWASGTGGTVLHTTDDGKTWQTCPIPLAGTKETAEKLDFRGIQAFDENTAIVMSSGLGDQSRLYKTTDGCQTWKLLFTNPDKDGFWDAISLTRSSEGVLKGWLLGDPVHGEFTVWKTETRPVFGLGRPKLNDGPNFTRTSAEALAADPAKAGAFAASNSALFVLAKGPWQLVGLPLPPLPVPSRDPHRGMAPLAVQYFVTGGKQGARLFISHPFEDDVRWGEEWTSGTLPLGTQTEASGAFSIAMRSYSAGVIVGGNYQKPDARQRTAVYLRAKSKNWLPARTPPHGYRSAVAYDSTTKKWITVGPNGTDISTDDGRNWRPLTPTASEEKDADKNWNALSLPFVVGPKGRIGKLRTAALNPIALPPTTGSKPANPK